MDQIEIATEIATIKADQVHIKATVEKMSSKLDTVLDERASVKVYKRLTWGTLMVMVAAFIRSMIP